MSTELPPGKNTNEEVDLIVFFNLIGNAVNRLFLFVKSILKSIYNAFIRLLQYVFLNIKIIISIVFLCFVLGFFLDFYKDKIYYSEMFVVPNFDSKYELVNNIKYYNSLIIDKNYEVLSLLFGINQTQSRALVEFEIEKGPDSKNAQLTSFNNFLKPLDSITKTKVTFEEYIESRNIYNSTIFLLRLRTKDNTLFKRLEVAISSAINSELSLLEKKQRDSTLVLEKQNLDSALVAVRALKKTYLSVLEKESDKKVVSTNLPNNFEIQVQKTETKESQLLAQELQILSQLKNIKKELVVNNDIFNKKSSFKEKGLLENIWYKKFKFILPILGLALLFFTGFIIKLYKYVINYK